MNWKSIIGTVAPTIATALGGPMAGAAVKFLGSQFLGDENANEEKVANFVRRANPETLMQIKQADQEFALQMERLGVDVFKLESEDKKDARSSFKGSHMPSVLSVGLTLIIGVLLYALFYIEPPEGAREPLLIVLGMIVKEWSNSMHYWFGTTRSSSDKTKMIK